MSIQAERIQAALNVFKLHEGGAGAESAYRHLERVVREVGQEYSAAKKRQGERA